MKERERFSIFTLTKVYEEDNMNSDLKEFEKFDVSINFFFLVASIHQSFSQRKKSYFLVL